MVLPIPYRLITFIVIFISTTSNADITVTLAILIVLMFDITLNSIP